MCISRWHLICALGVKLTSEFGGISPLNILTITQGSIKLYSVWGHKWCCTLYVKIVLSMCYSEIITFVGTRCYATSFSFNTLRQTKLPFLRRHFQMHFLEWKYVSILLTISLKFVHTVRIKNISALVWILARYRPGDRSEPIWTDVG